MQAGFPMKYVGMVFHCVFIQLVIRQKGLLLIFEGLVADFSRGLH